MPSLIRNYNIFELVNSKDVRFIEQAILSNCLLFFNTSMYQVEFTPDAIKDLRYFRKFEQNKIIDSIQTQLVYEPTVETKNRFRRDPPMIAEWELRIGEFRVFYNVEESIQIVSIERIGQKPNNTVFFRGQGE